MTMTQAPPAAADSDAELVGQAQRGRLDAFERLYRRHHARVYAVCVRLHRGPEQAEDSLQDAFVLAWQRLAEFRGDAEFSTWLHRIAVNAALQNLRRLARRERHLSVVDDDALQDAPAPARDTDAALDLESAIAQLPDGARVALVLHDIEGYSHDEIAALTGLAVGTSKAQLHRARMLLRGRLTR